MFYKPTQKRRHVSVMEQTVISANDQKLQGGMIYGRFVSLFEARVEQNQDLEIVTTQLLQELVSFATDFN